MSIKNIAKWNINSKNFFNSAKENSIILDIVISLSCKSQTGKSFEELVNALNSEEINKKIKQINILDTTYLYRYFYSEFSECTDVSVPTKWYLENKEAIEKIKAKVVLKCWATEINSDDFRFYLEKIKQEFSGDANGNGMLLSFRDTVIREATINSYKHNQPFKNCVDFILEECAHICSCFKSGAIICYPMKLSPSVDDTIKRYSLNINHLSYRVHDFFHEGKDCDEKKMKILGFKEEVIEKSVTKFMKDEVTNMNFFVVNKEGNLIYSNFALNRLVNNELDLKKIDKEAWKTTSAVINSGQMFIGEEKGPENKVYLSMKAPLRVEGKIEGAIGISIDITDTKRIAVEKKKTEELEFLNKIQQIKIGFQTEFTRFISQMAHDIASPLVSLEVFTKTCKNLNADQQYMLTGITSSIRDIADDLLKKYKYNKREFSLSKEQHVLVAVALTEIIAQKRLQYKKSSDVDVKIYLSYDPTIKFSFINGDYSSFSRMISNLINNAVEASKGQKKVVNIKFRTDDSNAIIDISDSGEGMSSEMLEKIRSNMPLDSSKKEGCGLGLQQAMETVRIYNGKLEVTSEKGQGTTLRIIFPLSKPPKWVSTHISLHKDNIVMVFDKNISIHNIWTRLLNKYSGELKLKFFKDAYDAIDFFDALAENDKKNVVAFMDYDSGIGDAADGLDGLLQCGLMKRSVIATSTYHNKQLQNLIASSGAKILPKQFLSEVELVA